MGDAFHGVAIQYNASALPWCLADQNRESDCDFDEPAQAELGRATVKNKNRG